MSDTSSQGDGSAGDNNPAGTGTTTQCERCRLRDLEEAQDAMVRTAYILIAMSRSDIPAREAESDQQSDGEQTEQDEYDPEMDRHTEDGHYEQEYESETEQRRQWEQPEQEYEAEEDQQSPVQSPEESGSEYSDESENSDW